MTEYLIIEMTDSEVFNYFFTLVLANGVIAFGIQMVLRIMDRS
jgi:hypothetical protein